MAIVLILISVLIYTWWNRKKLILKATRRLDNRYTSQLRESENEIHRLTIVNEELMRRNSGSAQSTSISTSNAALINTESIVIEQKKLEAQQLELSNKNKMLWEMSVSIEKEKMHIQTY